MSEMLDYIKDVARGAGEILAARFGTVKTWKTKADRGDIVTEVDLESEQYIFSRIRKDFPEDNILAEESGRIDVAEDSRIWYVDPLDGTQNFAMGIPLFGVSVAVATAEGPQYGVVYDPIHDETFAAQKHKGAFLNGTKLAVSSESSLQDALVVVSWVGRQMDSKKYMGYLERMNRHTSYFRRLGSAALMLSYVASGRIDAYLQGGVKPWDVAAGMLLVTEAGGKVTDLDGKPLDITKSLIELLAANPTVNEAILREVVRG